MKYNSYSSNGSGIKVISGAIATIILGGIVLMTECTPVDNNAAIVIEEEEVNSDKKIKFKAGEHIISTSIELDKNSICQIDYHDGYKLEGITIDSDGKTAIYTNIEDVWCTSQGKDANNNDVYNEFGEPEVYATSKDYYDIYEHTLAVPISNPSKKNLQYIYHEGYEVIDVASYVSGKYETFGNGYIIYSNNVPVKCERDENDKCLDFGTPITTEKVKTLR